jgi:hypothetical protein
MPAREYNDNSPSPPSPSVLLGMETRMRSRFRKYLDTHFKEAPHRVFEHWDFETFRRDLALWRPNNESLYVYILARVQAGRIHTEVGCSSRLRESLSYRSGKAVHATRKNSTPVATPPSSSASASLLVRAGLAEEEMLPPGGSFPTKTGKRREGTCRVALCIVVPPYRNFGTHRLRAACERGRELSTRCLDALEIARQYGLACVVSSELCRPDSPLYCRELDTYLANLFTSSSTSPLSLGNVRVLPM